MGKVEERTAQRLRIAAVLKDLARWKESEDQLRHALSEATELANVKLAAKASSDLAQLLLDTNRTTEAEPLMRRALEIDAAAFGEQHPTVATDLDNLATLLEATNRLGEAEPLRRRALAIDVAAFGEQHPRVATDLCNLATLLLDTSRLKEAEPLMRRSLDIFDSFGRETGHEHPYSHRVNEGYQALRRAIESDERD